MEKTELFIVQVVCTQQNGSSEKTARKVQTSQLTPEPRVKAFTWLQMTEPPSHRTGHDEGAHCGSGLKHKGLPHHHCFRLTLLYLLQLISTSRPLCLLFYYISYNIVPTIRLYCYTTIIIIEE